MRAIALVLVIVFACQDIAQANPDIFFRKVATNETDTLQARTIFADRAKYPRATSYLIHRFIDKQAGTGKKITVQDIVGLLERCGKFKERYGRRYEYDVNTDMTEVIITFYDNDGKKLSMLRYFNPRAYPKDSAPEPWNSLFSEPVQNNETYLERQFAVIGLEEPDSPSNHLRERQRRNAEWETLEDSRYRRRRPEFRSPDEKPFVANLSGPEDTRQHSDKPAERENRPAKSRLIKRLKIANVVIVSIGIIISVCLYGFTESVIYSSIAFSLANLSYWVIFERIKLFIATAKEDKTTWFEYKPSTDTDKENQAFFRWTIDREYKFIDGRDDFIDFIFSDDIDVPGIAQYVNQQIRTHKKNVSFVMLYHCGDEPDKRGYYPLVADELVRIDHVDDLNADIIRGVPLNPDLKNAADRGRHLEYPVRNISSYGRRVRHIVVPTNRVTLVEGDDGRSTTLDELPLYKRDGDGAFLGRIGSAIPHDDLFGDAYSGPIEHFVLDLPDRKQEVKLWTKAMAAEKTFFWGDFGNVVYNFSKFYLIGYGFLAAKTLGQDFGVLKTFNYTWMIAAVFIGHILAVLAKGLGIKAEKEFRNFPRADGADGSAPYGAGRRTLTTDDGGKLSAGEIDKIQAEFPWMPRDYIETQLTKDNRGPSDEIIKAYRDRFHMVLGISILSVIVFLLHYPAVFNALWPSSIFPGSIRPGIWFALAILYQLHEIIRNTFWGKSWEQNVTSAIRFGPIAKILGTGNKYFPMFSGGWRTNIWFQLAGITTGYLLHEFFPIPSFLLLIVMIGMSFVGAALYPAFAHIRPEKVLKMGIGKIVVDIAGQLMKALKTTIVAAGLAFVGGILFIKISKGLISYPLFRYIFLAAIAAGVYTYRQVKKGLRQREEARQEAAQRAGASRGKEEKKKPFIQEIKEIINESIGLRAVCAFVFFSSIVTAYAWMDLSDFGFLIENLTYALDIKRAIARGMAVDYVAYMYLVISGVISGIFIAVFGRAFIKRWLWPDLKLKEEDDGPDAEKKTGKRSLSDDIDYYANAVYRSADYAKDDKAAINMQVYVGLIIGSGGWLLQEFLSNIQVLAKVSFINHIIGFLTFILILHRAYGKVQEAERMGQGEKTRQERYGGIINASMFFQKRILKKRYITSAILAGLVALALLVRYPPLITCFFNTEISHALSFGMTWKEEWTKILPMWLVIGFTVVTLLKVALQQARGVLFIIAQRIFKEQTLHWSGPMKKIYNDKFYMISGYLRPRMFIYIQSIFTFLGMGLSRLHPSLLTWNIGPFTVTLGFLIFVFACIMRMRLRYAVPFHTHDYQTLSVIDNSDLERYKYREGRTDYFAYVSNKHGYRIVPKREKLRYRPIETAKNEKHQTLFPEPHKYHLEFQFDHVPLGLGLTDEDFENNHKHTVRIRPRRLWRMLRKFRDPHEWGPYYMLKTASGGEIPFYAYGAPLYFRITRKEEEIGKIGGYPYRIRLMRPMDKMGNYKGSKLDRFKWWRRIVYRRLGLLLSRPNSGGDSDVPLHPGGAISRGGRAALFKELEKQNKSSKISRLRKEVDIRRVTDILCERIDKYLAGSEGNPLITQHKKMIDEAISNIITYHTVEFDSIVIKGDDKDPVHWLLGFNSRARAPTMKLQELFCDPTLGYSRQVLDTIMDFKISKIRKSLLAEYILHEALCPLAGHKRSREIQEELFPENYGRLGDDKRSGHKDGFLAGILQNAKHRVFEKRIEVTPLGGIHGPGKSAFIVDINRTRILIDAGLDPVTGEILDFSGIDAGSVDYIMLSHAHLDHTGSLMAALDRFPNAKILATGPTLDMASVLIKDSASRMQGDPASKNRFSSLAESLKRYKPVDYDTWYKLSDDLKFNFSPAGHILGAAVMTLATPYGNMVYSGDISLKAQASVRGMSVPDIPVDTMFLEALYGNRSVMQERAQLKRQFSAAVEKVVNRGGSILIPSFTIGRSTELAILLKEIITDMWEKSLGDLEALRERGGYTLDEIGALTKKITFLLDFPIYVDGLAAEMIGIYEKYKGDLLPSKALELIGPDGNLFFGHGSHIRRVDSFEKAGLLDDLRHGRRQAIVIAGSGMLIGGNSVRYLNEIARHSNNAVFRVGYASKDTPAYRLSSMKPGEVLEFNIGQRKYKIPINAETAQFHFSAHSARNDLLKAVRKIKPSRIFLIHAKEQAKMALREKLMANGDGSKPLCKDVRLPKIGETLILKKRNRRQSFERIEAKEFSGSSERVDVTLRRALHELFHRYYRQWEFNALKYVFTRRFSSSLVGFRRFVHEKLGDNPNRAKMDEVFYNLVRIKHPYFSDKHLIKMIGLRGEDAFTLGQKTWGLYEMFITGDEKEIVITPSIVNIDVEEPYEYFVLNLKRKSKRQLVYHYGNVQIDMECNIPPEYLKNEKMKDMNRVLGIIKEAIGLRINVAGFSRYRSWQYHWLGVNKTKRDGFFLKTDNVFTGDKEKVPLMGGDLETPAICDLIATDSRNRLVLMSEFGRFAPATLAKKFSSAYMSLTASSGRGEGSLWKAPGTLTLSVNFRYDRKDRGKNGAVRDKVFLEKAGVLAEKFIANLLSMESGLGQTASLPKLSLKIDDASENLSALIEIKDRKPVLKSKRLIEHRDLEDMRLSDLMTVTEIIINASDQLGVRKTRGRERRVNRMRGELSRSAERIRKEDIDSGRSRARRPWWLKYVTVVTLFIACGIVFAGEGGSFITDLFGPDWFLRASDYFNENIFRVFSFGFALIGVILLSVWIMKKGVIFTKRVLKWVLGTALCVGAIAGSVYLAYYFGLMKDFPVVEEFVRKTVDYISRLFESSLGAVTASASLLLLAGPLNLSNQKSSLSERAGLKEKDDKGKTGFIARGDAGELYKDLSTRGNFELLRDHIGNAKESIVRKLKDRIDEADFGDFDFGKGEKEVKADLNKYVETFLALRTVEFNSVRLYHKRTGNSRWSDETQRIVGWCLGFNTCEKEDYKTLDHPHEDLRELLRLRYPNHLGLSRQVLDTIEAEYDDDVLLEYLFHELVCCHYGHENTRILQEAVFSENYREADGLILPGHKDARLSFILKDVIGFGDYGEEIDDEIREIDGIVQGFSRFSPLFLLTESLCNLERKVMMNSDYVAMYSVDALLEALLLRSDIDTRFANEDDYKAFIAATYDIFENVILNARPKISMYAIEKLSIIFEKPDIDDEEILWIFKIYENAALKAPEPVAVHAVRTLAKYLRNTNQEKVSLHRECVNILGLEIIPWSDRPCVRKVVKEEIFRAAVNNLGVDTDTQRSIDASVSTICRTIDDLAMYYDMLCQGVPLDEALGNREKYSERLLIPLYAQLSASVFNAFENKEEFMTEFVDSLPKGPGEKFYPDFTCKMNADNGELIEKFRKITLWEGREDLFTIGYWGLLLMCIASDSRPYFAHLVDIFLEHKGSAGISMSSDTGSVELKADAVIHMYPKSRIFGRDEAPYMNHLMPLHAEKAPEDLRREGENSGKIRKALDLWAEKAPDAPVRNLIARFKKSTTVLELDRLDTFSVISDFDDGIVQPVRVGKSRRVLYFTKKYLDSLDANDEDDMCELAFWLNYGQRYLDMYKFLLDERRAFDEIKKGMSGFEREFLDSAVQYDFLIKGDVIKGRLREFLREDTIVIYTDMLRDAIKKNNRADGHQIIEDINRLEYRPGRIPDNLAWDYKHAIQDTRRLMFTLAGMGLNEWVSGWKDDYVAAVTGAQLWDTGAWPCESQMEILFTLLRMGDYVGFIRELTTLLSGKGFPRNIRRQELEILEMMIDIDLLEINVRHAITAHLETCGPEQRQWVMNMSERINRLLSDYRRQGYLDLDMRMIDEVASADTQTAEVNDGGYFSRDGTSYYLGKGYKGKALRLVIERQEDGTLNGFTAYCGGVEAASFKTAESDQAKDRYIVKALYADEKGEFIFDENGYYGLRHRNFSLGRDYANRFVMLKPYGLNWKSGFIVYHDRREIGSYDARGGKLSGVLKIVEGLEQGLAGGLIAHGNADEIYRRFLVDTEIRPFRFSLKERARIVAEIKTAISGVKLAHSTSTDSSYKDELCAYVDHLLTDRVIEFDAIRIRNEGPESSTTDGWCLGFNTAIRIHDRKFDHTNQRLHELLWDRYPNHIGYAAEVLDKIEHFYRGALNEQRRKHMLHEYLFHELVCPYLGHRKARMLQEKIFHMNYDSIKESDGPNDGYLTMVLRRVLGKRDVNTGKGGGLRGVDRRANRFLSTFNNAPVISKDKADRAERGRGKRGRKRRSKRRHRGAAPQQIRRGLVNAICNTARTSPEEVALYAVDRLISLLKNPQLKSDQIDQDKALLLVGLEEVVMSGKREVVSLRILRKLADVVRGHRLDIYTKEEIIKIFQRTGLAAEEPVAIRCVNILADLIGSRGFNFPHKNLAETSQSLIDKCTDALMKIIRDTPKRNVHGRGREALAEVCFGGKTHPSVRDRLQPHVIDLCETANDLSVYLDNARQGISLNELLSSEDVKTRAQFLWDLVQFLLRKLHDDFSDTAEFAEKCEATLNNITPVLVDKAMLYKQAGAVKLSDKLRISDRDILESFQKIGHNRRTGSISISMYALLLLFLSPGNDAYIKHLYSQYILAGRERAVSYHDREVSHDVRGDAMVRLYNNKNLIYGSEGSYYQSNILPIHRKDVPDDKRQSDNAEKIDKAVALWLEGARSKNPDYVEQVERFKNSGTVIELEGRRHSRQRMEPIQTFMVTSDPDRLVARPLEIGRNRKVLYFSRKYLDGLDKDNVDDMKELAVWLFFGQAVLDRYYSSRDDGEGADQDRNIDFMAGFIKGGSYDFLTPCGKLKERLIGYLEQDMLTVYRRVLVDGLSRKRELSEKLKPEALNDVDVYGTINRNFFDGGDVLEYLTYLFTGMGLDAWALDAYKRLRLAISGLQLNDIALQPVTRQVDLVFAALRMGRPDDFIHELGVLLTGVGFPRNIRRRELEIIRGVVMPDPSEADSFEASVKRALNSVADTTLPEAEDFKKLQPEVDRMFEEFFRDEFRGLDYGFIDENRLLREVENRHRLLRIRDEYVTCRKEAEGTVIVSAASKVQEDGGFMIRGRSYLLGTEYAGQVVMAVPNSPKEGWTNEEQTVFDADEAWKGGFEVYLGGMPIAYCNKEGDELFITKMRTDSNGGFVHLGTEYSLGAYFADQEIGIRRHWTHVKDKTSFVVSCDSLDIAIYLSDPGEEKFIVTTQQLDENGIFYFDKLEFHIDDVPNEVILLIPYEEIPPQTGPYEGRDFQTGFRVILFGQEAGYYNAQSGETRGIELIENIGVFLKEKRDDALDMGAGSGDEEPDEGKAKEHPEFADTDEKYTDSIRLNDGTTAELVEIDEEFFTSRKNVILGLVNMVPHSNWSIQKLTSAFQDKDNRSFAYVNNKGVLVGILLAYKQGPRPDLGVLEDHIFIRRLVTRGKYRRQGVATRLLHRLAGDTDNRTDVITGTGDTTDLIVLRVNTENEPAVALYEKLHFDKRKVSMGDRDDYVFEIRSTRLLNMSLDACGYPDGWDRFEGDDGNGNEEFTGNPYNVLLELEKSPRPISQIMGTLCKSEYTITNDVRILVEGGIVKAGGKALNKTTRVGLKSRVSNNQTLMAEIKAFLKEAYKTGRIKKNSRGEGKKAVVERLRRMTDFDRKAVIFPYMETKGPDQQIELLKWNAPHVVRLLTNSLMIWSRQAGLVEGQDEKRHKRVLAIDVDTSQNTRTMNMIREYILEPLRQLHSNNEDLEIILDNLHIMIGRGRKLQARLASVSKRNKAHGQDMIIVSPQEHVDLYKQFEGRALITGFDDAQLQFKGEGELDYYPIVEVTLFAVLRALLDIGDDSDPEVLARKSKRLWKWYKRIPNIDLSDIDENGLKELCFEGDGSPKGTVILRLIPRADRYEPEELEDIYVILQSLLKQA